MKKPILIIMFLVLSLGVLVGCSTEKDNTNEPILPPTRIGEFFMKSNQITKSFDELIKSSDAAIVKIGNWLGEDEHSTYYEAEILEVARGDFPNKIILKQNGNSQRTEAGEYLYTYGNVLFLFLDTYQSSEYGEVYFRNGGQHLWVSDAVLNDGEWYILPRASSSHYKNLKNYIDDISLYDSLTKKLKEQDPYLDRIYFCVFLYEDIIKLMK